MNKKNTYKCFKVRIFLYNSHKMGYTVKPYLLVDHDFKYNLSVLDHGHKPENLALRSWPKRFLIDLNKFGLIY